VQTEELDDAPLFRGQRCLVVGQLQRTGAVAEGLERRGVEPCESRGLFQVEDDLDARTGQIVPQRREMTGGCGAAHEMRSHTDTLVPEDIPQK
jgi:hypothetical protein